MGDIKNDEEFVCFVVSPIGETGSETRKRADQVLKHIVEPCVSEFANGNKHSVIRADKISNSGLITHQIINYIINADLVIADLTDTNPNVFYELAIRHVLRKPYIQLCDINTKLPFDVQNLRTIFFDYKDLDSVSDAKSLLKEFIEKAINEPDQITTPIHESLAIESLLQSDKPNERLLGDVIANLNRLTDKISNVERAVNKGDSKIEYYTDFNSIYNEKLLNSFVDKKRKKEIIELYNNVGIGVKVKHRNWGIGEIVEMNGQGAGLELTISFPDVGLKRLLAFHAPITLAE